MSTTVTPSPDVATACHHLDEHGLAVLPGALTPRQVADVRTRLLRAAEASEADGVPTRNYAFDPDSHNVRVFHLFNHDPVFVDLVRDARALGIVEHLLGPAFLVSNFSANITEPGNRAMQMHADQGYVLPPWPAQPLACNVAWLLDDMTDANGGTRYVPDSHRWNRPPERGYGHDTVTIEAPAGSMLVMDGRLWHQTGENRTTGERRAALFGYYVLRWLRTQVNWNAALWPETVARLDPAFLHLLGYYSGNVEFQIPSGQRAQVPPPAERHGGDFGFALGPSYRRKA